MNRTRSWIFRLKKQHENSFSAHFITLTYDPEHVPRSPNGFKTFDRADLVAFFKALRKLQPQTPLKYYLTGEYGTAHKRPHYHLILFNVVNIEYVHQTWKKGFVHHGTVTNASIAYTLEYMSCTSDLDRMHGNDDRLPEFSTFSKGIGENYVTPQVKTFHKQNLMDMYITIEDGTKIPMPRFYRNKIFTDDEKSAQAVQIGPLVEQQFNDEFNKKGPRQMEQERKARLMKIKKKSKKS